MIHYILNNAIGNLNNRQRLSMFYLIPGLNRRPVKGLGESNKLHGGENSQSVYDGNRCVLVLRLKRNLFLAQ